MVYTGLLLDGPATWPSCQSQGGLSPGGDGSEDGHEDDTSYTLQ